MKQTLTLHFKIFLSAFFLTAVSFFKTDYACLSGECEALGSGWYPCQAGTMCCYGHGCPSQCVGCEEGCTHWSWVVDGCDRQVCMTWGVSPYPPFEPVCLVYYDEPEKYDCAICDNFETCECACEACTTEPPPSPNNPPVCTRVTGPATLVSGGPAGTYTCTGTDSDGTIDRYSWVASGGTPLTRTGTPFTWTPPTTTGGTYNLTCTVRDNDGATDACPAYSVVVAPPLRVNVSVDLLPTATACGGAGSDLNGVVVNLKNGVTNASLGTATTSGNGNVTFNNISRSIPSVRACVTYAPPAVCTSYTAVCPAGISAGCSTPVNVPASGDLNMLFGFKELVKDSWVSAIDGDVYANSIGGKVPCSGNLLQGNFTANLINLHSLTIGSAYASAYGGVTTTSVVESGLGGYAKSLGASLIYYLSKFRFDQDPVEAGFTSATTFANVRNVNRVYYMTLSNFNNALAAGPVSYNLGADGVSVLYVYDAANSGTLAIRNTITAANEDQRIVIVTSRPIRIYKEVGFTSTATYNVSNQPNIQAALITSQRITVDEDSAAAIDRPLMLQGPLVSFDELIFNRDLGTSNDDFPAVSVKMFSPYIYKLTVLERANKGVKSFTGFGMYDSQWVYEN